MGILQQISASHGDAEIVDVHFSYGRADPQKDSILSILPTQAQLKENRLQHCFIMQNRPVGLLAS